MPCLRPVKNMHRSKLLGAEGLALCLTNPKRDNKSSCPSICCPSATKNFTARIQGSRIRLESGQPRDSLWLCFTYADASAGCSQANCRDIQLSSPPFPPAITPPGSKGASGDTGVALVEVYEVR
jgi:hypothetical protein